MIEENLNNDIDNNFTLSGIHFNQSIKNDSIDTLQDKIDHHLLHLRPDDDDYDSDCSHECLYAHRCHCNEVEQVEDKVFAVYDE